MSDFSIRKDFASGLIRFETIDQLPSIASIIINNPTKRNALSRAMWLGIAEILDACLNEYRSIRVLIFTGQGSIAFSSGADLTEKESEQSDDDLVPKTRQRMRHYPLPILSEINGFCLGGGLALAMCTDLRFASSKASFSIPAVKLGVPLAKDIVDRLLELIGEAAAKTILFTGDRISADHALRIGLIQHVCATEEELHSYVLQMAKNIAGSAPLSIQAMKVMMDRSSDPDRIEQARERCLQSRDLEEGRRAFREKRSANFQGC